MTRRAIFIVALFSLIFAAHAVAAAPAENIKTAYTAVQVYNLHTTESEKIATIVAANYLQAMTITVTITSPRILTPASPYYTTIQPGGTTVFYTPKNGRYYVNAIESDGTVIFFTDHEIYWNWDRRNNTVTMTVEKTSIASGKMLVTGYYNSWGTPITLTLTFPYPLNGTSETFSSATFYYTTIPGAPDKIELAAVSMFPTYIVLYPRLQAPIYFAKIVAASAKRGTIVYTAILNNWYTTKKTALTLYTAETWGNYVTLAETTFSITSTNKPFEPWTYWPTSVTINSTTYQVLFDVTAAFLGGENGTVKYYNGFIEPGTTVYTASNPEGVTAYFSNGHVTIVSHGKTVYRDGTGEYTSLFGENTVEYYTNGPFTQYIVRSAGTPWTIVVEDTSNIVSIISGSITLGAPTVYTVTTIKHFFDIYPKTIITVFLALGDTTGYLMQNFPVSFPDTVVKIPAYPMFTVAGYNASLSISASKYTYITDKNWTDYTRTKTIPLTYSVSVTYYAMFPNAKAIFTPFTGKYISANPLLYYLYSVSPTITHDDYTPTPIASVHAPPVKNPTQSAYFWAIVLSGTAIAITLLVILILI